MKRPTRKQSLLLILVVALVAATSASIAFGGSYNFYFNNTEQGANSTANPSINATPNGVQQSGAQQTQQVTTQTSPDGKSQIVTSAPQAAPASVAAAPTPTAEDPNHQPILRVGLSWMDSATAGYGMAAPGASLEVFPLKELSLFGNVSGGVIDSPNKMNINALINFYPLMVTLGHIQLEIGGSAGIAVISSHPYPTVGGRANLHLAKNWNISAGLRYVFAGQSDYGYGYDPHSGLNYDIGLQFKFL